LSIDELIAKLDDLEKCRIDSRKELFHVVSEAKEPSGIHEDMAKDHKIEMAENSILINNTNGGEDTVLKNNCSSGAKDRPGPDSGQ
jgi:hypothetical protein